jgi:hypothetical protein
MIYLFILISLLFSIDTIEPTSFGTSTKDLKQPVNFSGTITTHQGQEYTVDNISINTQCKQIPMYDKPVNHAEPVVNNETKQQEIKLITNPADDLTKIDLSEVSQINVPKPDILWYYQKKEKLPRQEFIEVEIITKSDTKRSYLLDPKTPIYCDELDAAGPQEKTIRLLAIKTIIIEGYTYRDTSKDKKDGSQKCPPCPN